MYAGFYVHVYMPVLLLSLVFADSRQLRPHMGVEACVPGRGLSFFLCFCLSLCLEVQFFPLFQVTIMTALPTTTLAAPLSIRVQLYTGICCCTDPAVDFASAADAAGVCVFFRFLSA